MTRPKKKKKKVNVSKGTFFGELRACLLKADWANAGIMSLVPLLNFSSILWPK